MAVERTDYSIAYEITEDGRTDFSFPFSAGSVADIHVFDHDPALSETDPNRVTEIPPSGFQVTPGAIGLDGGGSVILAASLPVGHNLEIRRVTPQTQDMVLHNQAQVPPKSLEKALDKLTRLMQEIQAPDNEALIADLDDIKRDVASLQSVKADRTYVDNADALLDSRVDTLAVAVDNKVTEAPADGKTYGRKDNAWAEVEDGLPTSGNVGDVLTKTANTWGPETTASLTGRLAKASATAFGVAKVDGTTITSSGGVLTAVGGGSGGGGTTDHSALINRDLPDQHQDYAVSRGMDANGDPYPLDQYLDGVDSSIAGINTALAAKANQTDVDTALATKAPIASPVFTGAPSAPTPNDESPDGQLATKGYVDAPADGKTYGRKGSVWAEVVSGGLPVGFIIPWPFANPDKPPPGFLALNGAEIGRATCPDLWAIVEAEANVKDAGGNVIGNIISEAEWQTRAAAQSSVGQFSSGDGSTTFRLPRIVDYIRGMETGGMIGEWLGDMVKSHVHPGKYTLAQSGSSLNAMRYSGDSGGTATPRAVESNDATALENRPKTIRYPYYIKAFDAVVNPGLVDVTELANDIANLSTTFSASGDLSLDEVWTGFWDRTVTPAKKIYRKTVDCGTAPNGTSKTVAHGIANIQSVIRVDGEAVATDGSNTTFPLPFPGLDIVGGIAVGGIIMLRTGDVIFIRSGENRSAFNVFVILEYTCTDR